MSKHPLFVSVAALAFAQFAGCSADLADGNPCHALIHATCERLDQCSLFAPGADVGTCLDDLKDSDFSKNCAVGVDRARSCGADMENVDCSSSVFPASCAGLFYGSPGAEHTLLWPYGAASTGGSGQNSAGGSSGTQGVGGSSGKGGTGGTGGSVGKVATGGTGGTGGSSGTGAKGGSGGSSGMSSGATVAPSDAASFVGKWSGTVARTCTEDGIDCSSSRFTFQADITLGGRGIELVMPGTYDSTDPPGANDCPAVTLSVSGSTASATDQQCNVAAQGGVTKFTLIQLDLISADELEIDIRSSQQVNSANLYVQEYQGLLTN